MSMDAFRVSPRGLRGPPGGGCVLARTKTRQYTTTGEELRHWREGLDQALRSPRKRRRPLKALAIGLVLLVIVAVGGTYTYAKVINGLLKRTNVTLAPASGQALNVLMVGSDSREGLTDPKDVERFGEVGGKRADTIILAQFVPNLKTPRGVLVSFPRDLFVTVIGGGRQFQSKINAAYGFGPQSVIDTVGALTGVPINHYMEVDIRGFRGMVDALGGIDVTTEAALYDSKLNFHLPAGKNHLDGNQALSFVRARHATPDGDFGRIKRQQQFLKAVTAKVGLSVLANPRRVNSLARAFASNVKVDQFFQIDDLVRFALSVRRVGPDQLETFSVPGNIGRVGAQSVVLMDQTKATPLFQALRDVKDPGKLPGQQASSP
jgi:LCP family protein required for cell wall assembly